MKRQAKTMKRKRFKAAMAAAVAALTLQGCTAWPQADMERLCGHWESTEGKPDVVIRNDGGTHKVTLMSKGGKQRKLKPQTFVLMEDGGNMFIDTGYRIGVSYNENTDVLTFPPYGDYKRKGAVQ